MQSWMSLSETEIRKKSLESTARLVHEDDNLTAISESTV
jgi:hypothetical protein